MSGSRFLAPLIAESRRRIAGDRRAMAEQHDLSRAMPRSMNNLDAAGDGQYFPRGQRLVNGNRLHSLVGMEKRVHIARRNRPGAAPMGRKGPPLSAIGISSGCM